MTSLALDTVAISLEVHHTHESCGAIAGKLHQQMSSGYEECAVQPIPNNIDDWRDAHRTARKRADRAWRRGYTMRTIDRHRRVDEIHRINVSAPERQGRPMAPSYRERPAASALPDYPCKRHAIRFYGIEDPHDQLVAYLALYRCGQLALVSQILGHADHLENEIMWLLIHGVLEREREVDQDGYLVYNRWDSGTPGLRWFKQHAGFEPMQVEWLP